MVRKGSPGLWGTRNGARVPVLVAARPTTDARVVPGIAGRDIGKFKPAARPDPQHLPFRRIAFRPWLR